MQIDARTKIDAHLKAAAYTNVSLQLSSGNTNAHQRQLCSFALPELDFAMFAEGKHHLPKLAPPPEECMKNCWLLSLGAGDAANKLTIGE